MLQRPDVDLIERLHQYGRELAVLKRMYQSYALIIERILKRKTSVGLGTTTDSEVTGTDTSQIRAGRNTTIEISQTSSETGEYAFGETPVLGAPLCSAATARFERLLDRVNHFALSEIQECLDEKEALVFLVCHRKSVQPVYR